MAPLTNTVADRRAALGLSQTALAARVGISRQALAAVETGRSAPSTPLALRLAHALETTVEDLFALPADTVYAETEAPQGRRVALGRVHGRWVAHALSPESTAPADGLVTGDGGIELLETRHRLEHGVFVAGCAPVLGALAGHVDGARWLPQTSGEALHTLAIGRTHLAGLHLAAADDPATHDRLVRAALPGVAVDIVSLVGWREGLAVAPGNPLALSGVGDLDRPGLRLGRRPEGSGAAKVLARALSQAGLDGLAVEGRPVRSHLEAARAIVHGAVDAAVVIEPIAEAFGLPFFPLSEERFELVLRAEDRAHTGVARLLEALGSGRFVREVRSMGAYDTAATGVRRSLEVA